MSKDISVNLKAILNWLNTGTATVVENDVNEADTLEAIVTALASTTIYTPATLWTGVTAGAVLASRVVSVDANRDVATLRNVTLDGTLTLGVASAVAMGVLSSANDTSGVHLTASKSKAIGIHADTGGAALAAGNIRAGLSRFLIGTVPTAGQDISTYGHEHLLKFIVNSNVGGNQGGSMGHLETAGVLTLTGGINVIRSGVASFVDIAAGGIIPAGTVVSAFGVNPANFGTLTGRASIIHVPNPMAGTWSSFLDISTATGLTQAAAAGATADKFLKVYVNGVLYTIAMATA
jgi:hypothetical protein